MPIVCNKNNFIKRRNYGVKVARPYYDVRSCSDNQLLFNSSWPIVLITGVYKEIIVKTSGVIPSGATIVSTQTENFNICASNDKYVYTKKVVTQYNNNGTFGSIITTYGHEHYESHPVLAFPSSELSDLTGYVVCTNIDISKDVDYPYTDAPLEYFGGDIDYGIKSRAYFMHDMPRGNGVLGYGINTRLSSKMVQAVKTQETFDNGQTFIAWKSPKANSTYLPVTDYECYSFYTAQTGIHSDALYPANTRYDTSENCAYMMPPQGETITNVSMLILRNPMISPNNVEVNYNGS